MKKCSVDKRMIVFLPQIEPNFDSHRASHFPSTALLINLISNKFKPILQALMPVSTFSAGYQMQSSRCPHMWEYEERKYFGAAITCGLLGYFP